ncbi:MAG: helix-turn-helix transcriptional regulator [Pseudomonadota bacterium]
MDIVERDLKDVDRLVESFYAAAFHCVWQEFRPQALQRLCEWCGAVSAAWLTRAATDLAGEYAAWPAESVAQRDAVAAIAFAPGSRERELRPVPAPLRLAQGNAAAWALALNVMHRDSPMRSTLCVVFADERPLHRENLRRAVGHLAQAGSLSLSQFIQRDEWLQALGRASRGCAALIDADGGIYVASRRFQALILDQFGVGDSARLPFALPPAVVDAAHGDFDIGPLHFRLAPEGGLYLLHARRPHPLDVLSPREQEIALALAAGKTFKSVARECDIAISTVANHASRIYKKLGIYRREELVGMLRAAASPRASVAA